ncbi:MAG: bi-domain-containing oxidoreductase [Gemmatimonadales bacterium]
MKQVTLNYKTNELVLKDVPPPAVQQGAVLVRTAFSAISLGTEGMKVTRASKGLVGMARERPDQVRQVLDTLKREGPVATYNKVMNRLDAPTPLGYSLSGVVAAVGAGVIEFQPGDRVACAGEGIAVHAEMVAVPKNLCARVPAGVSLEDAAFATIGAIAMQGVRQAGLSVGEIVVVIGLGLVGQLAVQICRAAGCRVFGVDLDPAKCELAVRNGADQAVGRADPHLEERLLQFTGGRGADAVLVTAATPSSDPVQLAVELCRDRGTVVVLGIVGMEFQFEKAIKREVQIRMSRSYGPGRYDPQYELHGIDYPIGYVRWTEQRNMESFLELVGSGSLRLGPIVTHRFRFGEAEAAYAEVRDRDSGHAMGILLEYDTAAPLPSRVELRPPAPAGRGEVVLGVIGAGTFARNTLLPALRPLGVRFRSVANATGLSARHTADRFGFESCTTRAEDVLEDPAVNWVLVATRHDTHASLTGAALRAGKAAFVEKPLAMTREELGMLVAAHAGGAPLMVGFNRRFAPATDKVLELFRGHAEPLVVNYRVNAGYLPPTHWLQDPVLGGGRVIGEACHFIDWMRYVVGAPIVSVTGSAMANGGVYSTDNVAVQLRFEDGSLGNLLYVANGDAGLPKEYVEIFSQRSAAVIDDYRRVRRYVKGREETLKLGSQDKGHRRQMTLVVEALRSGKAMPIPAAELFEVTDATFAVLESIASGQPVRVGS